MKYDISFENEFVLIILSGQISPLDYGLVAKDLVNSPLWKPNAPVLIDYSYIDLSSEIGHHAEHYAMAVAPYKDQLGDGRLACVNTNPADYGLGRIWQAFMQSMTSLEIGIFYTYEDAMCWLTEKETP